MIEVDLDCTSIIRFHRFNCNERVYRTVIMKTLLENEVGSTRARHMISVTVKPLMEGESRTALCEKRRSGSLSFYQWSARDRLLCSRRALAFDWSNSYLLRRLWSLCGAIYPISALRRLLRFQKIINNACPRERERENVERTSCFDNTSLY